MSQGDATGSQSAMALGNNDSQAPNTIMQSFKRGRYHLEPPPTAPTILLNDQNSGSTSSIQTIDDPLDDASTETVIANYNAANTARTDAPSGPNQARYLVSKLDRLHDKKERYLSHRQFLQKCLDNDIIPNGLRLDLEPTIGNHDEDFLKNWYGKLEEYSKNFMKEVLSFCDKTNIETDASINALNAELNTAVEKEQYDNVQATVIQNNTLRSQELQRRKNKKFYALKYKKETPRRTNDQTREAREEHSRTPPRTPAQVPATGWNHPPARTYAAVAGGRYGQHHRREDHLEEQPHRTDGRYDRQQHRGEGHHEVRPTHQDESRYERHHTEGRYQPKQHRTEVCYGQQQHRAQRVRSRQDLSRRGSHNHDVDKEAPLHEQISLQRKRSFRREDSNEQRLQAEIKKLQSQLSDIHNSDNRTKDPGASGNRSIINGSRDQDWNQKNVNNTQNKDMGANNELIQEAFSFVTDAMQTLKKFEAKFATMLNTHKIPSDRL